jgi:cell wall-associated NlpC family hydrolase
LINKKIAAVGTGLLALSLATCSSTFAGATTQLYSVKKTSYVFSLKGDSNPGIVQQAYNQKEADAELQKLETIKKVENTVKINSMIKVLKSHVGITPYVPTGASTSGWDCSGMVRWGYLQIGVDLYHGATHQRHSGKIVLDPKPGDIVVFGWSGVYDTQHSAIYIGDGLMIQAGGKPGDVTNIMSVDKWADENNNTYVTYTRILETN